MITGLLARIFGTANEREIEKIKPLVAAINSFESDFRELADSDLILRTNALRQRISMGSSLDDLLPEAFALVKEAAGRAINQRHYDVQLIGGVVMHSGKIAEMKTGEGKTLTATLALSLNALAGKGVHLVTVNDYLARRDAEWMGAIYTKLGLSIGCLQNNMSDQQRRNAYNSDILYATNNELGFDYLRDNMKFRLQDYVQRELSFAIVDEVDSILIDEARTPLIISGSTEQSSDLYVQVNKVVGRLAAVTDYEVHEKDRVVLLTEAGVDRIEEMLHVKNLYAVDNLTLLHHVNQSLRAHALFRRDVDYVVRDQEVMIVDEFTGRILQGRRYSDGLHQALEAKEGVSIEQESQTLASITLQNFFRMYDKLAGMTGTALTEAEELYSIYKLPVVSIPTNRPMVRDDKADLIFLTNRAKYKAIVEDIQERNKKGQPVLIGTIAVETSETLSHVLSGHNIPHDVLNAKNHAREAEIVEHAGKQGKVTIATNMAGRGTDIKLTPESVAAGGLYILGTERHESRRIDNQLRGRSGRQGDAGESRFYISLEDDLIRIFSGDTLKKRMEWFGMKEDEVIESPQVSRIIEKSQEKVEKHNAEMRKSVLEYDDVLNQQRMVVYQYRKDALESDQSIAELIREFITDIISLVIKNFADVSFTQQAQDQALQEFETLMSCTVDEIKRSGVNMTNQDQFRSDCINFFLERYALIRNQDKKEIIHSAERWLVLNTIDHSWKQHMLNLDHLKDGIGLRGWGRKNPLIEYKRESFEMFQEMMLGIKQQVVYNIFRLESAQFNESEIEAKRLHELNQLQTNLTSLDGAQPIVNNAELKIGRNDLCHCGSGKKFKKCHGVS
jgi:preprotein translocase subunit SecA